MESSRGIYKPIRVLFGTPIYETTLDTCWHLQGYKTQIAVMREFLRLQQEDHIPPQITAEDMSNLLVQESKKTVREQLWEFKMEDFEEKEAKPLLKLVWAVNVNNRMRDVEFQAQMLLKFPKATPPTFQNPKLLSMANKYIEMLIEMQQETQTSRLLTAEDVVIEVVPRVLQGFWQLPPKPLLNMASKSLSVLCTSVTKATLDKVSKTVTTMESQAIFSSSIRDGLVQTILREIREQMPLDILLNSISNVAPKLLSTIAVVAQKHICTLFKETPFQSLPTSGVLPSEEPTAEPPSWSEALPSEEPTAEPPSSSEALPSEEPTAEPPSSSEALPSEEPTAEPPSSSEALPSEEPTAEPPSSSEALPSEEPTAEPPSSCKGHLSQEPTAEPPSSSDALPSEEPTAEPPSSSDALPISET
ncbi:proline-rich protein 36-like [Archocentrus centrarchus]|uniref:proline-rich protein 36-like n=1 Tax=Archocentrus centrarchus TaxID=63155 RepID=UPI0011EA1556|nr:proline-rich protein 36-like [Archocentrus centrarchus]